MIKSIKKAYTLIENTNNILIGAGAGLSIAAGLDTGINTIRSLMPEYEKEYGIKDLYYGSFYPFKTRSEQFAYWSKAFYWWRFQIEVFKLYKDILNLIKDKNYFIITTNGDGQFIRSGFNRERIFLMQGDHGDFVCSQSCCNEIYDSKPIFETMIKHTINFKVPEDYMPKCPYCGSLLIMRQRSTVKNLEIKPYLEEKQRYENFLKKAENCVLLELGVVFDTPTLIKFPFWSLTAENKNYKYISVNLDNPRFPNEISDKTIYLQCSINDVIDKWLSFN